MFLIASPRPPPEPDAADAARLSERAQEKALEASTPREEQKSLLLTANPHGDRVWLGRGAR